MAGVWEGVSRVWRYLLLLLLFAWWSRFPVPAASCHAPPAPDCLIPTFQVRRPNKPRQCTLTVIHLFGSRRCSSPLPPRSPRGISHYRAAAVDAGEASQRQMTGVFFPKSWVRKEHLFFLCPSSWPIFLSIVDSRQRRPNTKGHTGCKKKKKVSMLSLKMNRGKEISSKLPLRMSYNYLCLQSHPSSL